MYAVQTDSECWHVRVLPLECSNFTRTRLTLARPSLAAQSVVSISVPPKTQPRLTRDQEGRGDEVATDSESESAATVFAAWPLRQRLDLD